VNIKQETGEEKNQDNLLSTSDKLAQPVEISVSDPEERDLKILNVGEAVTTYKASSD
jgi:hypothetical protein